MVIQLPIQAYLNHIDHQPLCLLCVCVNVKNTKNRSITKTVRIPINPWISTICTATRITLIRVEIVTTRLTIQNLGLVMLWD
jgi:hypothetical protein